MYSYETEKAKLFTENGQKLFLKIRDRTWELLKEAGACRASEMMSGCTGDSWEMIACIDRMVELGEIKELTGSEAWGQYRVFTKPVS